MEMSKLRLVGRLGRPALAVFGVALAGQSVQPARAVPSFAAQTGQPCQTCHITWPSVAA